MAIDFFVDIENSAGVRQGNGPITSASNWQYTARMDKAGVFSFEMPASDPKALTVQKKRIAKAYALLNGQRVEVGAGIIDNIQKQPQADGTVILAVSGDDLVRELTYRSVLNLKLYLGGNPVTHATALAAVGAFAPAGWAFTPDGAPPNDSIYGYFNGELVLAGVAKIAEKSQNHFYRGSGRSLVFASSFTPSGVRAIQARGDLSAATCAIVSLTEQVDTYDLITRIYPRGSGNANVQLTLRATNRAAPVGYTLDAEANYIENTAATATYGRIERQIDFRDIGPVENTNADIQAASNMLFDAALETLRRQSTELEQATYTLQIAGCSQLLRPMQSIRVVYRDTAAGLDINTDLNILEATWQVDASGLYTTDLVVSNADRWPQSDVGTLVDSISNGNIYQALPQLNANSYVTAYNKLVDETEIAAFRFRFGNEVTQLQQVLFEFQLLPLESSVKAVGGASSGSGDIPTGAPSVPDTGSGGNNETGSGGAVATGAGGNNTDAGGTVATGSGGTAGTDLTVLTANVAGPTEANATLTGVTGGTALTSDSSGILEAIFGGAGDTVATGAGNTGAASGDTGAASGNTGAASGDTGTAAGNTGNASGNTGTPSTNDSGGPSNDSTSGAQGGDVDVNGRHAHQLTFQRESFSSSWYNVYYNDGDHRLKVIDPTGGTFTGSLANADSTGEHTHTLQSHTHTLSSHNHSLNLHAHSLNSHNHSLNNHAHSLNSHVHTLNGHAHSLGGHTHSIGVHTHGIGSHTHFVTAHNHSIASHTHTIDSHTHTINQHTHTINAHTHGIATHTHSIAAHTHSIAAHTHSMAQHTHTLNNHTHDLSESITAIYGIFRESALNTFALADLEYRVNSGTWFSLDTATDEGSGWRALDITSLVQNTTTFRPLQESNLLEVRRKAAGATGKTAQLDAQLSVRNVIQAIAYA